MREVSACVSYYYNGLLNFKHEMENFSEKLFPSKTVNVNVINECVIEKDVFYDVNDENDIELNDSVENKKSC
jgi:hypothetical protein